jgi:hypothetical protein
MKTLVKIGLTKDGNFQVELNDDDAHEGLYAFAAHGLICAMSKRFGTAPLTILRGMMKCMKRFPPSSTLEPNTTNIIELNKMN